MLVSCCCCCWTNGRYNKQSADARTREKITTRERGWWCSRLRCTTCLSTGTTSFVCMRTATIFLIHSNSNDAGHAGRLSRHSGTESLARIHRAVKYHRSILDPLHIQHSYNTRRRHLSFAKKQRSVYQARMSKIAQPWMTGYRPQPLHADALIIPPSNGACVIVPTRGSIARSSLSLGFVAAIAILAWGTTEQLESAKAYYAQDAQCTVAAMMEKIKYIKCTQYGLTRAVGPECSLSMNVNSVHKESNSRKPEAGSLHHHQQQQQQVGVVLALCLPPTRVRTGYDSNKNHPEVEIFSKQIPVVYFNRVPIPDTELLRLQVFVLGRAL